MSAVKNKKMKMGDLILWREKKIEKWELPLKISATQKVA